MAEYTKGEWWIDHKNAGYWPYVWRGESGMSIMDHDGDIRRAMHDALLIAASKEMLETLEMLRAFMGNPVHKGDIPVFEELDRVIAKALGLPKLDQLTVEYVQD